MFTCNFITTYDGLKEGFTLHKYICSYKYEVYWNSHSLCFPLWLHDEKSYYLILILKEDQRHSLYVIMLYVVIELPIITSSWNDLDLIVLKLTIPDNLKSHVFNSVAIL